MNKLIKLLDRRIVLRKNIADILLGVVVLLINAFLMFVGTEKYITEGYGNQYGITPRTFPRFVFGIAMFLGLLLILRGIRAAKAGKNRQEESVEFYLISVAIFLNIVIFVLIMKPVGYPVANLIMMYIMYWLSGGTNWWKGLLIAVIFTVISILFFYTYLKLPIPLGIAEFLFY